MTAPATERERQLILDGNFDAETYWADRPFKKWVENVGLGNGSRRKAEMLLVRAASRNGAEPAAISYCASRQELRFAPDSHRRTIWPALG